MTTVYLIRHGTTDSNLDGRFQGCMAIPLNRQGLEQAALVAEYLSGAELAAVYSSPLLRAKQTAGIIASTASLEVITRDGLREIYGGELEGHTGEENDTRFPEAMRNMRENPPLFAAPGGESAGEVYTRMAEAVEQIAAENPNRAVAAVSHGYAIQTYLAYVIHRRLEKMKRHIVGNASITVLEYKSGCWPEITALGLEEHLPPEMRFGVAENFMKA